MACSPIDSEDYGYIAGKSSDIIVEQVHLEEVDNFSTVQYYVSVTQDMIA